MQLNQDQDAAFKRVLSGQNTFIDGPGGVGKSVLIRHIRDKLQGSTIFIAPTGIAALNIKGATIHSTFKLPLRSLTKNDYPLIAKKLGDIFDKETSPIKRIVIDEAPMMRVDIFKAIDESLRRARRLSIPFGGLQIVVVGDFYQLPPVLTDKDKQVFDDEGFTSPFCFSESTWSGANFAYVPLTKVMRQSDEEMINHLFNIRTKSPGWQESLVYFNEHGRRNYERLTQEDPTYICTTNRIVDHINTINYEALPDTEYKFYGELDGDFSKSSCPSPQELKLKYGTKVIFTANEAHFKNGQPGYVVGFERKCIQVLLEETETVVDVPKYTWEEIEYNLSGGNVYPYVKGTYCQYPIKYGWAITVHKSQGQTMPSAIFDIGNGAFAHGQTYVALSRLQTINGFGLARELKFSDVIISDEIKNFYANGCRGLSLF